MSFNTVSEFENKIAEYYGAPYAVATDSCTHGIELCLRYENHTEITVPTRTYISIPKEAAPDVNIPIIYISLSQKGISANDSERLLVKPIEDEVKTVEGIKEIRSTAYSGGGNVLLEFDAGFNADKAMDDIRE